MTKKRLLFLILFVLAMGAWGIGFGGNSFYYYLDLPSLAFVPILPYLVSSFIYPFSEQKKFKKEIFTPVGTGDKKELEKAIAYFELLKKLTISSAVLASLIGLIGILGELSNISTVGKWVGVLLITVFYASIFILAVVEPLKGAAKKNLIG